MKTQTVFFSLPLLSFVLLFSSCNDKYLDAKPNTNLITPSSIDDIIALLDNTNDLNMTGGLGQMGADEYIFVDYAAWQGTFYATDRNAYIWAEDIYEGQTPIQDWNAPYRSVFYANNALQSLVDLNLPRSPENDQVKGWALFIRSYAYYDLLRNFTLAYDPSTADQDLGLPLRLSPNIDEIKPRTTLKESYEQVINDLLEAGKLLTEQFQYTNRNRPSKATAYALLARIYLSMNLYQEAELYVDKSLGLYNKLTDYNNISLTSNNPFSPDNDEVIFRAREFSGWDITRNSVTNTAVTVNPTLLDDYNEFDLRFKIFFAKNAQGQYYFKTGYYSTGVYPFHGLAVDENYLIKAECLARNGQIDNAMEWLNKLLVNRYDNTQQFEPLFASTNEEAIALVLKERQKELIWRGIRWSDIKRLNKIGANITLRRNLNGKEYTLLPNDPRYAFPIPDDEITRSNIQQNIR